MGSAEPLEALADASLGLFIIAFDFGGVAEVTEGEERVGLHD